jgi:hypothetical protein
MGPTRERHAALAREHERRDGLLLSPQSPQRTQLAGPRSGRLVDHPVEVLEAFDAVERGRGLAGALSRRASALYSVSMSKFDLPPPETR